MGLFISLIGLLLLILVLVATYLLLDTEKTSLDERTRSAAPGQFIRLSQGMVHYELVNYPHPASQPRPLVVLVHGFSVPSYVWDTTFIALKEAGYPVLRFDLYGRGWSDRPPARADVPETAYGLGMYLHQLEELLVALHIEGPIDLVGLSMGGPIVAAFANRHPQQVRRLVLIAPLVQASSVSSIPLKPAFLANFLMAIYYGLVVLPRSQAEDFHQPGLYPDWVNRFRIQMRYKGFRQAILATLGNLAQIAAGANYPALSKLALPVLLIWGEHDRTIPEADIARLREMIPNVEYHSIPQAGHLPHHERPDLVNPLVITFIAN